MTGYLFDYPIRFVKLLAERAGAVVDAIDLLCHGKYDIFQVRQRLAFDLLRLVLSITRPMAYLCIAFLVRVIVCVCI